MDGSCPPSMCCMQYTPSVLRCLVEPGHARSILVPHPPCVHVARAVDIDATTRRCMHHRGPREHVPGTFCSQGYGPPGSGQPDSLSTSCDTAAGGLPLPPHWQWHAHVYLCVALTSDLPLLVCRHSQHGMLLCVKQTPDLLSTHTHSKHHESGCAWGTCDHRLPDPLRRHLSHL
jgi:hypothetical protein